MGRITQGRDGAWVVTARFGTSGPWRRQFRHIDEALRWDARAARAIADSTLRRGGARIVLTARAALDDYLLSCGALPPEEGGDGQPPSGRFAAFLDDPALRAPVAGLDAAALAAMRAAWSGAGRFADILLAEAALDAALARLAARELHHLENPCRAPAPDGVMVIPPDTLEALLRAARRGFHPSLAVVLRLCLACALPLAAACALTWPQTDLRRRQVTLPGPGAPRVEALPPDLALDIEAKASPSDGALFPNASEARVAAALVVLGRRLELGDLVPASLLLTSLAGRLAAGMHPDRLALAALA